jgi:flagellar biosynthesis protein FlhF
MRLKTFTARNMPEAMAQVKAAMGEEAVIMASKEDKAAGIVTVTAAVEEDVLPVTKTGVSKTKISPSAWRDDGEDPLDQIDSVLDYHGVPRRLASKILRACASETHSLAALLQTAIADVFSFSPLTICAKSPVALIGMPGAGKTVTAAKLVTRAVLAGQKMQAVTLDTAKAGGSEQLSSLMRVLGVPTHTLDDAQALDTVINHTHGNTGLLIDTAGVCPWDEAGLSSLQTLLTHPSILPVLVLPTGLDAREAADVSAAYRAVLPLHGLLVSRLDSARRLGSVLSAAESSGLPLLEAGISPMINEGLLPLNPPRLVEHLLRHRQQNVKPFHVS